ncbi:MAG TPA: chalcone isomerase family protein [Chitinophagales bacterium]
MKKVSLFAVLFVTFTSAFSQKTISGVSFPAALKTGDNTFNLVGGGIRKKFFIDVYVAALYLQHKNSDGVAVAKTDEAQIVRLVIVSGLVTSDKMVEATTEGFEKSTGGNTAPIKDRMNAFMGVFKKEPIVKGDVFDFIYTPTAGLQVIKNGKQLSIIKGLDFKTALFGIWIGANPVDKTLKGEMLGTL